MKKEDLRPIEYHFQTNPQKGYFHQIIVKKEESGGDFAVAIIEAEDGTIRELK
jgi:hypothetical protein